MNRTIPARSSRGRTLEQTFTKRNGVAAALLAASALALTACGSSASTGAGGSGNASPAAKTQSAQGDIHVGTTSLGKVLVDKQGFTLYMFAIDKMNKSNCNAACLHYWPAVKPEPAGMMATGVTGKLGSTKTPTGEPIATINGMPLYTYVGDHSPGDVNGQGFNGFGGLWWVVSPSGKVIKSSGSSNSGSSSGSSSSGGGGSGGGGGYSY